MRITPTNTHSETGRKVKDYWYKYAKKKAEPLPTLLLMTCSAILMILNHFKSKLAFGVISHAIITYIAVIGVSPQWGIVGYGV